MKMWGGRFKSGGVAVEWTTLGQVRENYTGVGITIVGRGFKDLSSWAAVEWSTLIGAPIHMDGLVFWN